jgi:hypothetical protein
MHVDDKKDLEYRLNDFSLGDKEFLKITRLEAQYLGGLVAEDWRKR